MNRIQDLSRGWSRLIFLPAGLVGGYFEMNIYNTNPVEEKAIADLEREHINKALEQLTQTQHRRLELFFFYNWTERQIAEYEGINRYAVRTSLDSAIKKLKKIL